MSRRLPWSLLPWFLAAALPATLAAAQPARQPAPAPPPPGRPPPIVIPSPPGSAQPPSIPAPGAQPPGAQPPGPGAQPPLQIPDPTVPPGPGVQPPGPSVQPPGPGVQPPGPGVQPPGPGVQPPGPGVQPPGPPPGPGVQPPGGPPPAGGWGPPPPGGPWGPPPPGGWGSPGGPMDWGPPDPAKKPDVDDTVSRAGVPLGRRGAIGVETSSFTGGDTEVSTIAIALVARMPLRGTTFLDVRVPFALSMDTDTDGALGNGSLGAHHVARVGKRVWIGVGGALGFPMLSTNTHDDDGYEPAGAANAYWNLHEYFPSILPILARVGLEGHAGPLILRLDAEPVIYIPLGRNEEFEVAVQHAFEVQIGHTIGGGMRFQGVALPTFDSLDRSVRHETERDVYQFAIEPFLVVERKSAFLRAGVLLPLDEELGPPLDHTWGFRISAGMRID